MLRVNAKIYCRIISRLAQAVALVLGLWAATADADQNDPRLDDLFRKLTGAGVAQAEARGLEKAIWEVWGNSGSATVDLLMQRGEQLMEVAELDSAIAVFDDVVALAPGFSEGWNKRATAYFLKDDYQRALKDIERTLTLEARHFGALAGLGSIMAELGEDRRALRAYQMALKINPHLRGIAEQAKKLELSVKGRGI